jgi:hypothetical protein
MLADARHPTLSIRVALGAGGGPGGGRLRRGQAVARTGGAITAAADHSSITSRFHPERNADELPNAVVIED